MIAGIFHEGSGLGDQLFRYITVRTLAEEKGLEWMMINSPFFKGEEFMVLKKGSRELISPKVPHEHDPIELNVWNESDLRIDGIDRRSYDPEINFVEDNTAIDGSFEDSKYWHHNLENINKWLVVEPLEVPIYKVVTGFRGGEYSSNPDLFLPLEYYEAGMEKMMLSADFEVHTDDVALAKQFFKDYKWSGKSTMSFVENTPISHSKHTNMGFNWRSARYAKYAIIPNSAFFIIPRLLKHFEDPTAVTIAPRYWARRNTKVWARPACYYKEFSYI